LTTVTARKGAPGIDGQTTEAVEKRAEEELALIQLYDSVAHRWDAKGPLFLAARLVDHLWSHPP
jgi:hypothetical protein